jgi:phosphoglycolate phosphatase
VKPVLIFDLDGTLADSKKDLTASVNHVRSRFGQTALSEAEVAGFIGDGALMLVRRALGPAIPEVEIQQALQTFLSYYRAHMLDETTLYPGVQQTLAALGATCDLAVLTNKPIRFSISMLEGLGIRGHFAVVYGGNSFERKKPDPSGVLQILQDTGGAPENTWMIGDSAVDVLTGRNAGVATCGVTWGYAADTFSTTPPDVKIDRFEEVAGLIERRNSP